MSDKTTTLATIRVELGGEVRTGLLGVRRREVIFGGGTRVLVPVAELEPADGDVDLDREILSLASDPRVVGLPPGTIALILRLLWPIIERILSRIDRQRSAQ